MNCYYSTSFFPILFVVCQIEIAANAVLEFAVIEFVAMEFAELEFLEFEFERTREDHWVSRLL